MDGGGPGAAASLTSASRWHRRPVLGARRPRPHAVVEGVPVGGLELPVQPQEVHRCGDTKRKGTVSAHGDALGDRIQLMSMKRLREVVSEEC